MTELPPAIRLESVSRHYLMGESVIRAVNDVSLTVPTCEFLALLGPSGSGKSTLLNLIAGLDRPTFGTLRIDGNDLGAMSQDDLTRHRRRNVGIIFQSFNLVSTMTALENVTLAMMFDDLPKAEREQRGAELLESMGLAGR